MNVVFLSSMRCCVQHLQQLFLVLCTLAFQHTYAQFRPQFGISVDARWQIDLNFHYLSNFRLSAAVAAGAESDHVMPYIQYTVAAFKGGMGASFSMDKRDKINFESRVAFGCVGGSKRKTNLALEEEGINALHYRKLIYTMGFFNPTPLANPYTEGYFSFNGNFIIRKEKYLTKDGTTVCKDFGQYVGSASLGGRGFDLHYFNDGMPFHIFRLGDSKDRYWTGGGFIAINLKNSYDHMRSSNHAVRRIVAGFDRFTGYSPNAFEVANYMGLKKVPYKDAEESFYNKSRTYFGADLVALPGFMPLYTIKDNDHVDIQHFIHNHISKAALHPTFHEKSRALDFYYNYQSTLKN